MRKLLFILLSFFITMQLSTLVARENVRTDEISYDKDKIISYQKNAKYDYNSQLTTPDTSLDDVLRYWLNRILRNIFGNKFAQQYTDTILISIVVLMILIVLFFIFKNRPELFFRESKKSIAYQLEEESIYDIDFEEEIKRSLNNGDYKLAVRLVYLQTLRYLQDHQLIDWQPYKTPTEYIYELKNKNNKEQFRQLTNHFLRVRYGNFNASESTYQQVRALQSIIKEGGANEE